MTVADGSRNRMWMWVLGILAAAVAVWLLVPFGDPESGQMSHAPIAEIDEEEDSAVPAPPPEEPVTGAAGEDLMARLEHMRAAVRRYEDDCSARLEQAAGEGTGDIVVDCMERLAAAMDAIVASDTVGQVAIDERLEYYGEQVERLEATPPGQGRAGPTRNVLRSAAELLAVIRDERYAESVGENGAMEDVRAAAAAIDPERSLADQQDRMRQFFVGAGALLSAMARPGDPGPGS